MISALKKAASDKDKDILQSRNMTPSYKGSIRRRVARDRYDRIQLFYRLQDDEGQDYEQLHLQSDIDPYYDPDYSVDEGDHERQNRREGRVG
jgi:hypothetical protein